MHTDESIKTLYFEDVQAKSRIVRGFKASKWRTKPKRHTEPNSEVKQYMIWEREIVPYSQIQHLPDDKKREILLNWREKFTTKEIIEKLGISHAKYFRMRKDLGLPDGRKTRGAAKEPKQHQKPALVEETTKPRLSLEEAQKIENFREVLTSKTEIVNKRIAYLQEVDEIREAVGFVENAIRPVFNNTDVHQLSCLLLEYGFSRVFTAVLETAREYAEQNPVRLFLTNVAYHLEKERNTIST